MKADLKKIFFIFLICNFVNLFAQEKYDCKELLASYLENDVDLQKYVLDISKSRLSLKQEKLDQGFDISLSTGSMVFYPGTGTAGSSVTIKPSLTAKIPSVKNLSASVSTDYQFKSSSNTNELKDTKISMGFDILSSKEAEAKIAVLKKERDLLEAERKVKSQSLKTENDFYTELKEILTEINDIFTASQTVYTDKLSLEKLKAQGYSSSSSTYRIAQMKVSSGEHDIETGLHDLKLKFIVFYNHCKIKLEYDDEKFLDYIPQNIPVSEAVAFSDYPKEKYSKIESAKWENEINTLARKADKYFTLGLNAGYTVKNSTTKSDTVDAGVSTTIGGLGLNAGVSMPLGITDFTPAFTLSSTVSPNSFMTKKITKQQNSLSEEQELLEIKNAEQNYWDSRISYDQTAVNLKWEKSSVKENFDIYQKNEEDLLKYFKMGIVTESEYLSASNNRKLYEVKILINKLEYILYNNNVLTEFVDL